MTEYMESVSFTLLKLTYSEYNLQKQLQKKKQLLFNLCVVYPYVIKAIQVQLENLLLISTRMKNHT